jgi:7-alpha-hydroxysteroid dehydrogenase
MLEGTVGIVTGAGTRIGRATALQAAREGARLLVAGVNRAGGEDTVRKIEKCGGEAIFVVADLRREDHAAAMVQEALGAFGRLDWACNSASVSESVKLLTDLTEGEWDDFVGVSLKGIWLCMKHEIPAMIDNGGGSIVNIGSTAGRKAERGTLTHSLTKSAVAQLTRLMAADLAPKVRVNGVLPGAVETAALVAYVDAETRAKMVDKTAMRRNGQPEDIALAVLYFAAPASSWVTGKLLEVDGLAGDELVPKNIPDL